MSSSIRTCEISSAPPEKMLAVEGAILSALPLRTIVVDAGKDEESARNDQFLDPFLRA
jgi:hypothetical protein